MHDTDLHVSDQPSGLETAAFHAQLRRLESLQMLMVQGGAVVSEVAQFVVKAREELNAFQREQECYADAQRLLVEEKAQLLLRVSELEKSSLEASVRQKEQEFVVQSLQQQLAGSLPSDEKQALQVGKQTAEEQLTAAVKKIARLELELKTQRDTQERVAARTRREEVNLHGSEIALLKNRLAAVEEQLSAERERRTRLMEVVKAHEVVVNGTRAKENIL